MLSHSTNPIDNKVGECISRANDDDIKSNCPIIKINLLNKSSNGVSQKTTCRLHNTKSKDKKGPVQLINFDKLVCYKDRARNVLSKN